MSAPRKVTTDFTLSPLPSTANLLCRALIFAQCANLAFSYGLLLLQILEMLKLLVLILISSTWQVLLDQCCKTKILNGKEYQLRFDNLFCISQPYTLSGYFHLRETNAEAVSKYGCQDNCVFQDFENQLFCFKPGSFPAKCLTPTTNSNASYYKK
jgi:hypothetical protein